MCERGAPFASWDADVAAARSGNTTSKTLNKQLNYIISGTDIHGPETEQIRISSPKHYITACYDNAQQEICPEIPLACQMLALHKCMANNDGVRLYLSV